MQVIIHSGNKQRRIKGHFRMFGTKKDFESIARQITEQVKGAFSDGYVIITDESPNEAPVEDWEM